MAGLRRGGQNRSIAGAAAEVAGQCFVGLLVIGLRAVFLQGKQRHDKAGRTKATLRAVALDHRLLHAVELALMLEVFNADQLFAMQGRDECQAGIEAAIAQAFSALLVSMQLTNNHRAGAAITAGTAFLGAGFVQVLTQVIEYREVGVQCVFSA